MRLDSAQVQLPSKMLTVDLAEVGHEESVLIASIASVTIDAFNVVAQRFSDQTARQRVMWRVHVSFVRLNKCRFETC